jgi:hypothetical protein
MTIQETEYNRAIFNNAGDVVGQRVLLPGDSVVIGEVPATDVFLLPKRQVLVVPGGRAERRLHVLTRHPQTGQDRVSITPDNVVLTGDAINQAHLVFLSKKAGVTHIGIASTPNPVPGKPIRG